MDLTFTSFSLKIFGFVMLSGALATLLLPETRGRSLEELSNEHQKGFIRGTVAYSYVKCGLANRIYCIICIKAPIRSNCVMVSFCEKYLEIILSERLHSRDPRDVPSWYHPMHPALHLCCHIHFCF